MAQKPRSRVVNKAAKTVRNGSKGSKGSNGSKGSKGSKNFGATGGYPGVPRKQARQLVNGQVRDELRSMRNDRKYVNDQAADATHDANTLYNRSVGDLDHIFGEAGSYISHLGGQINSQYADTAQKVGAIDNGINAGIQQNTSAAQQAVQSELARLGIGGQSTQNLTEDSAFAQNLVTQQAGNNQANIAASQQAANTVTGLLGGMIQGSRTSNMGQALNTRNADIADIGRTKRDDLGTILDSMMELKKSRPQAIRDMLMQLQAQGFDQWQAIQALNMDRKSMNHGMAMDRAGMAEDSSYANTAATAWGAQANSNPYSKTPGNNGYPGMSTKGGKSPKPPKKPRAIQGPIDPKIKDQSLVKLLMGRNPNG